MKQHARNGRGYTIFANEGEYVEPTLVKTVKAPNGLVLEDHQPNRKRVLDPACVLDDQCHGRRDD